MDGKLTAEQILYSNLHLGSHEDDKLEVSSEIIKIALQSMYEYNQQNFLEILGIIKDFFNGPETLVISDPSELAQLFKKLDAVNCSIGRPQSYGD